MLAALAKSAAQSNPNLANPGRELNKQLTLDLSDGILDGRDAAGQPVAPDALRAHSPSQLKGSVVAQSAGRLTVDVGGSGGGSVSRSLAATPYSPGAGDRYPWATPLTLTA